LGRDYRRSGRRRPADRAVAAGPPIGGLITSYLGWRWAFLVNVPIGVALIGLLTTAVEESRDPDARQLDIAGIVSFAAGLFCVVWALIDVHSHETSSSLTLMRLGLGAALLLLLLARSSFRPVR
jgi:MFS family permease